MADKIILFAIVLAAALNAVHSQRQAQCCEEYCYELDNERPQSAHYGSKTAYQIVKATETSRQYIVPHCTPVKAWMLIRHGTRLPNEKQINLLKALEFLRDEVITNYEKRHSKPDYGGMCEADLDLLKHWHWDHNITTEYGNFLTTQGWDDLKFLAIRYQRAFPAIFESTYDERKFHFRYTNQQRTEASYKAFVEGLFGENANRYVKVPLPPANDTLLRPYDVCPTWHKVGNKLPDSERKKFESSPIFTQVVNDVSMRLGFKYPLKVEQIGDIFDMCRFDQAWKLDAPSAWCTAFTPSQISVMEYREDLKYYYDSGYGRSVNTNVLCEAMADMLKNMESRDLPKVVSYFTHESAVQLFLTSMGAAKDSDALRADNYLSMSRRNWRSSAITPFTANVAAIKYECAEEREREKVMFFLNEKPLDLSWCKVGLCNWSDVRDMYKRYSRGDCASTYCSKATTAMQSTVLYVVAATIALIEMRRLN